MSLLENQTMPSLCDVAHGCVHLLNNNNWKFHASSISLNAYSQLWEITTSETNHLIMGLVSETRTPSLDTSCKEGMAWCSSRPMHSLWSVYCVLCGSVVLTRTHWPMYRACIHKANLLKKLTLKLIYIQGYSQTSFLLALNVN